MENNQDNNKKCNCSGHSTWCTGNTGRHRLVILVIIVLLAFWLGMKLGEIKGFMYSMHNSFYMIDHHSRWAKDDSDFIVMPSINPSAAPTATPAQ